MTLAMTHHVHTFVHDLHDLACHVLPVRTSYARFCVLRPPETLSGAAICPPFENQIYLSHITANF